MCHRARAAAWPQARARATHTYTRWGLLTTFYPPKTMAVLELLAREEGVASVSRQPLATRGCLSFAVSRQPLAARGHY